MLGRLSRFLAHPDPRIATANRIAAVLGGNGPFYPLYVVLVAGRGGGPAVLLTMFACPFFLAVPFLARRHPRAARLLLMTAGIGNTVFCDWVLGDASGVALFFIPCVILAAMLFRADEKAALLPSLVLPLILAYALDGRLPGITGYTPAAVHGLVTLNMTSVLCLMILMGWMIAAERRD